MAHSPARSIDSTILAEDQDLTTTIGGLANGDQEPELVNQSPIAPLAINPVLSIDEVVAGQVASFKALPLPVFLPIANGFVIGDKKQPSWLEAEVGEPEDYGGNNKIVEDALKAQDNDVAAEEVTVVHASSGAVSPSAVDGTLRATSAQPTSSASSAQSLQEEIDITMLDTAEVVDQAGQLEDGELSASHGFQLSIVPRANAGDIDQRGATPIDLDAVADKLLDDNWFIQQVSKSVFASQDVSRRQLQPLIGAGAQNILVVNYTQTLIRYCEVAGLPSPNFALESRGADSQKRYRATVVIGKPKLTFTRPSAGVFGHKREVREDAAQAAWEHLINSGAILGTGYFIEPRQQQPVGASGVNDGRLQVQGQGSSGVFLDRKSQPPSQSRIDGGTHRRDRPKRASRLQAMTSDHIETTGPQAVTYSPSLFRFEGLGSGGFGPPKSPTINPERLQMLQHAESIDEPECPAVFDPELGPKRSGVNLAPLGRNRLEFGIQSFPTESQSAPVPTDPRRKVQTSTPGTGSAPQVLNTSQLCRPPRKRTHDQLECTALAARQLSHIGRLLDPTPAGAATKSMTGLVAILSGTMAALARVEAICKYVSIQAPQYFEVARDRDRIQWGARMSPCYLNAQVMTLGPTVPTWNEVLGKTACARQYVEPFLMAGIRLHGFGAEEKSQAQLRDEPGSKRQQVLNDGGARKYETIRGEVEDFVQGIKTEIVKTEPTD